MRQRLLDSYKKNCRSMEELLDLVAAVDEELLYASAATRLDYFKSAINWDSRLQIKQKQLGGSVGLSAASGNATPASPDLPTDGASPENSAKRMRRD